MALETRRVSLKREVNQHHVENSNLSSIPDAEWEFDNY